MTRLNVCNAPTKGKKGIDKENKHWCECRMWFVGTSCRGEESMRSKPCK